MLSTLRSCSSKCSLFHNAKLFGSCIIHILYTGCAKIKKKSGAKGLIETISFKYIVRDVLFSDIIKNILVFLMKDISVPTPPGKADIVTSVTDDCGDFLILPPETDVKNVFTSGAK